MQLVAINFSVYKGSQLLISTLQSVFNHVRRKEKYLFIVSTVLYTKTMISFWDKGKGQDSASTEFIWSLQQSSKIISLGLETISKLRDSSQLKEHSVIYRVNNVFGPGWGGGALPYLAYTDMCRWTAEYGFQGLESQTGCTISLLSVLNRVSFWTGSLSKTAETGDECFTFAVPLYFLLNVYFHDFSVKIT